jgi:IS30 family transposase
MVDEEIGMPARRELSMRQLRHLLRLHHGGVSAREIGRRLGVARSTIQEALTPNQARDLLEIVEDPRRWRWRDGWRR